MMLHAIHSPCQCRRILRGFGSHNQSQEPHNEGEDVCNVTAAGVACVPAGFVWHDGVGASRNKQHQMLSYILVSCSRSLHVVNVVVCNQHRSLLRVHQCNDLDYELRHRDEQGPSKDKVHVDFDLFQALLCHELHAAHLSKQQPDHKREWHGDQGLNSGK